MWAFGQPADPSLPYVIYRIDPETVTVTARAWSPGRLLVIDDVGFTLNEGRLETLDLDAIDDGVRS